MSEAINWDHVIGVVLLVIYAFMVGKFHERWYQQKRSRREFNEQLRRKRREESIRELQAHEPARRNQRADLCDEPK